MNKSDAFLEDRIRWRAKKSKLPTSDTLFWENRKSELEIEVPSELGSPVLLSSGDRNSYVVLCTRGIVAIGDSCTMHIQYSDIDEVHDLPMLPDEEKVELRTLSLKLKNGKVVLIYPEPLKPAFAVWNILIMLKKMS